MEQQDIKNKIWSNLDRLRTDRNFSGFRDTKLLELIGTTLGAEKLDNIFQDKELLTLLTNSYSITAPNYVFKFIEELIKELPRKLASYRLPSYKKATIQIINTFGPFIGLSVLAYLCKNNYPILSILLSIIN